ncbi:MAG TPA: LLM class flavin-dependent oxidoreductase [Beijerinckiaceae bacterium]|jgi:alkanesulfonate monooxygenase SsuD/methylene tetrahydromethanopterin reductase-like flavin-dependent oxidoreductase (luciferase family)|nr:LLM class flavin-dependent oxidoreductase [Beijerinckiaceae bacterium]
MAKSHKREDAMKVLWFHLMPYQDLPADFKDKHNSVWVDIDPGLFDPLRGHQHYHEYMDQLEYAAKAGFHGICVNEHHSNAYGMMPSPNLIAATLARNTRDAALCVLGNSVALYNPPTRVAEEMAMLDCISGGRLIAGFPVGTPMDTCYAYGQNPAKLRDRYYEGIDLVLKAWAADKPFAFNGRYTQQRYVNCWPRPVQKQPPIWIPGGGSVETWQMCAERSFVYANLSYFGHQASMTHVKGFWGEMKRLGKEPNPFQAAFLQFVGVAETRAEAEKLYHEPANYFYNRCLHTDPAYANPPGYTSEATVRARITSQVLRAAEESRKATRSGGGAKFFEEGHVIIGSPDEVAEKLLNVCKEMHVGHLLLLLHFGNMSRDLTKYNTDLFATKVLPQIKHLYEKEWEDHWWPTGMPKHLPKGAAHAKSTFATAGVAAQ